MSKDFAVQYGPWALIAGGSEGIGLCFAQQLAGAGINLILLARGNEALEKAGAELRAQYPVEVHTHSLDLTSENLPQQIDAIVEGLEVGLLVYNAGATHGASLFVDAPLEKAQQLLNLNCNGPVVLCHILGKEMRERGRGGIILLSSMGGLAGGAYIATYSATKAFDIVLAEALWAELKPFGVDVLGLIAGATDTPAMARSNIQMGASDSEFQPMNAADVAREGLENLPAGPLHVAGAKNREFSSVVRGDRKQAIEMMTYGAASMYGKPFPVGSEG